jgi:hypothetical protein
MYKFLYLFRRLEIKSTTNHRSVQPLPHDVVTLAELVILPLSQVSNFERYQQTSGAQCRDKKSRSQQHWRIQQRGDKVRTLLIEMRIETKAYLFPNSPQIRTPVHHLYVQQTKFVA